MAEPFRAILWAIIRMVSILAGLVLLYLMLERVMDR